MKGDVGVGNGKGMTENSPTASPNTLPSSSSFSAFILALGRLRSDYVSRTTIAAVFVLVCRAKIIQLGWRKAGLGRRLVDDVWERGHFHAEEMRNKEIRAEHRAS